MFKYKFRIDTNTWIVNIVPYLEENSGDVYISDERMISFNKDGESIFFHIKREMFPNYLKCKNFPWEILRNLNEVLNWKKMYDQYNELIKIPESHIYQPAFVGTSSFKYDLGWTTSTIQVDPYRPFPYDFNQSPPMMISCSCLCSRDR